MSPALAYWLFFQVMARAWFPAPKPTQKKEEA
jgi:hypothetical protein